jgi:hypothetical protein
VVALLDLKELDHLASYDTTLLVQDLDRMFQDMSSLLRVTPLSAIQHPRLPSSTSLAKIRGRCHELLPTAGVIIGCMPQFHTSQV